MKKIFKLMVAFVLCFTAFVLTACDSSVPTITVQSATAIRDKITIDFTIWDEDVVLTELVVTLTGKVDDGDIELNEYITVTGGTYAEEEDLTDDVELEDFIGEKETVIFNDLEVGETYAVVFTATYNDKARKISPTIDEGKDINLSKLTTSGEGGSKEDAHQISSKDDFDIIRNDPDGFFELTQDIDCENIALSPFFSSSRKFVGDFDGNNFTIKNFKQDNYDQYLGVFGYISEGGNVYDLTITNGNINSLRHTFLYMGVVAGYNSGTISNVDVIDCVVASTGASIGDQYVGGFVGYNKGTGLIEDCSATNIDFDLNLPASARVGGFVGTNEREGTDSAEIINSTATNILLDVQIENDMLYLTDEDINIELTIGGFVGNNKSNVTNCSVTELDVLIYVEGTQTDIDTNEEADSVATVKETERNSYVDSMNLRVGGFVGLNDSGYIKNSTVSIDSFKVECAYLDYIYIGGFAAENGYLSMISSCTFTDNTSGFDVIVSTDTYLATSENAAKTINSRVGVDIAYSASTFTIGSSSSITFNVKIRECTGVNEHDEKQYVIKNQSIFSN